MKVLHTCNYTTQKVWRKQGSSATVSSMSQQLIKSILGQPEVELTTIISRRSSSWKMCGWHSNFRERRYKLITRKKTLKSLQNLKACSELLRVDLNKDVEEYEVTFKRGEKMSSFPVWNLINGPLSDAIYHTGQIVSFRRASGNPLDPNVRVFLGRNRKWCHFPN